MDVVEQINNVIKQLDIIDEYCEKLPDLQSKNDLAISDLYHYIENNIMNTKSSYRIVKELKEKLLERRKLKNESIILKTYNDNKGKLQQIDNRKMLLSEIGKMQKRLSQQYVNRIYDEAELNEKLNK